MPGHTIPSEYSRVRNPGVPTKARIEDLAETPKEPVVYKEFFIAPNTGKTAATLLPRAQVYPEGGTGVMKLATARPKPFDPAKMFDHTDPVLTPAGIVANLGMELSTEQAWTKFLSDETGKAVNEVAFRKVVMEHAIEERLDRVVRRAILQRALMYWRGQNVEKALYIGPRGGKWADARHTIPWDQKRHAPGRKIHVVDATTGAKPAAPKGQIGLFDRPPKPKVETLGEEKGRETKPKQIPTPQVSWEGVGPTGPETPSTEGMARVGTYQDGEVTAYWDPEHHGMFFVETETGNRIDLATHFVDTLEGATALAAKKLGPVDRQPTLAKPEPALTIPKPEKKRRELAVEVGEHVWGSRADRAVRSADDLKELSPEDQAKYATKKNLMPVPSVDELLEANFTPSAIVMRRAIESCVQSKAPNSLLERQDYMNGVDYLARTLDSCKTGQEVEEFLHDWMNLAVGKKRDKTYSAKDMEAIRQEYLAKQGIAQTLSREELGTAKVEKTKAWSELRMADIAKMPKSHKKYKQLTARTHELYQRVEIAEKAFPQAHDLLTWKMDLPRYGGLSLEHSGDGSVTTYLDAPELAIGDNAYDSMAKALGPRVVNLVKTGGTYSTWGPTGQTPKVYKDARRLARDMQGESAEKQLEMLRAVTGGKGVKPRIKRAPYRWERKVPGEIDRVGGRPVTKADPTALAKDFGFKNVQFGNWVTEDDADTHLRGAHGALFDLADVLGVDPKAVGLNGRLALGFGARGSGSASAHYESGKKIINLTKIAGGGSLAHEWAHALDNIISVASDPEATEAGMYLTGGKVAGADRSVVDALDGVMAAMRWGGDAEVLKMEQRGQELLARRSRKERLSYTERRNIKSYQAAMAGKHRAVTRSKYLEDAQAIGGTGRNAYWTRPHEMFARAFEAYVEDALEDDGRRSSYLVSGTRAGYVSGRMVEGREAQPYPQGSERTAINAAMAKLVKAVVDTKSLEKALRVLDGARYVVDLEKAGPFIGPRGGKWQDAKHTIPWDPKAHGKAAKEKLPKAESKLLSTKPVPMSELTMVQVSELSGRRITVGGQTYKVENAVYGFVEPLPGQPGSGGGKITLKMRKEGETKGGKKFRQEELHLQESKAAGGGLVATWTGGTTRKGGMDQPMSKFTLESGMKNPKKTKQEIKKKLRELLKKDPQQVVGAARAAGLGWIDALGATRHIDLITEAIFNTQKVEVGKSMALVLDLSKAQPRGGKYHRRVPRPGGGYHYIYESGQYEARKDAHLDGEGAGKAYLSDKIAKFLAGAGAKGLVPDDLADLVKRHGAKGVAQVLRDGVKGGKLTHKKGRFYQGKSGQAPKLVVKEKAK